MTDDESGRANRGPARKSVAIIGTRGYPSYYGGFETLVRKLAPFLADQGWAVTVYCRPSATVVEDQHTRGDISTVTTGGVDSKSLSTLTYGATSVVHAAKQRPDVALVMNVANGYWLPLLRMRGIPTVVNVDGIEWHRDKWSTLGKAVFKMGAKLTAMHGDFLVADSVQIERFWDDTFNRRGTFIPYGGDVVTERLDPIDGLPSGRYVLFVARLVPENTVGEFLDATEKLSRNHPVVIVGSSGSGGILEARVRRLAEAHSNVRWLGHIADDQKLYSLWQNCGVYFHGHSVGGTNPALVQAMACGAPILARDTVFNREVLLDTGMFVEPRDQAIVDAVEKLLSDRDLQVELSARAQRRAKEAYSWRSVCASYGTALALAIEQKSK